MRNVVLAMVIAALALAQTPVAEKAAEFEVASVKPTATRDGSLSADFQPGGGFACRNLNLENLLRTAYQVEPYQLVGAPNWKTSAGFDIQAKAARSAVDPTRDEVRKMLQALLADRFHLILHRETRDLPIYALVAAKGGPKLEAAESGASSNGTLKMGHLATKKMTMASLASILTFDLKRPVRDETGLKGDFALTLEWSPGLGESDPSQSSLPSIFTALQEQLGLKLQSTKGPVEVLVIDHAELLTEN